MFMSHHRIPSFPRCSQRGISLIELIVFIAIVGVALTGTLIGMNMMTAKSADTPVHKQALTVAHSLLEEIEARTYSGGPCNGTLGPNAARSGVLNVCAYKGYYTTAGILDLYTNTPVPSLDAYKVNPAVDIVQITAGELGTIPAASAVKITVSVTDPANEVVSAAGYRAAR